MVSGGCELGDREPGHPSFAPGCQQSQPQAHLPQGSQTSDIVFTQLCVLVGCFGRTQRLVVNCYYFCRCAQCHLQHPTSQNVAPAPGLQLLDPSAGSVRQLEGSESFPGSLHSSLNLYLIAPLHFHPCLSPCSSVVSLGFLKVPKPGSATFCTF